MANATATELQQLYIAYFGRAADPTGLDYWTDQGTSTKAFAGHMHAQLEFKSVYGSLTTESQVNQIYQNLFDRDADAAGLLYWTKQIKSGALELASIANDLIWAATNNSGSEDDKKALDNKTSAAVAYTDEVKKTTSAILAYAPASSDPYVAGANIEAAKTYFAGIDKDTTHTAAGVTSSVATIKSNGVQTSATATTYTLTSDSPSITEGDTETKTLAFTLSLDKAATEATTINYETLGTGTATSGDDFVATSGTVSFAKGQKTASVNVTVNNDTTYENSGADETIKIKFSGTALAADVTATGSIKENDSDPDLTAKALTLTTGIDSLTGKKGNDTFDASTAGSLDSADTIDGGDGTDTLTFTLAGESVRPDIKNVETIIFTATTDTLNVDTRDMIGVTTYTSESSTGKSKLNNLSSIPTINLNSNSASSDQTINFTDAALAGSSDELKLNLNNFGGTTDIIITDAGGTTNKLETITIDSSSLASTISVFTTDDVDSTTLKITGDEALTIGGSISTDFTTVTISNTGGVTLAGANTTGVTITGGSGNDDLTAVDGADTIEAGAGNDTITSAAGNDTLKGGTGNDTFKFTGGNTTGGGFTKDDTIDGGAGTDTIDLADDATLVDADFAGVTNTEVITASGITTQHLSVTLGTKAAAAGVNRVTFVDAGEANVVVAGKDFTNDLTVDLAVDTAAGDSVTANADYTGNITVNADATDLNAGHTSAAHINTFTGGKGTDTLNIDLGTTTSTIIATELSKVTKVENFKVTDLKTDNDVAFTFNLSDNNATYTSATDYETLTFDATSIGASSDTINIDANAEVDGKVIIKAGDGVNTLTLSSSANFGDTITAGGGNDIIQIHTSGDLSSTDTVDGGAGTDTLKASADSTIVDADFTLVTNVEKLTAGADKSVDLTVDTLANAAGLTEITFTDTAEANDTVTFKAGFTSAVTVNLDNIDDNNENVVDAALYVGSALTVTSNFENLDQANGGTITGSANTNDIFQLSTGATSTNTATGALVAQTGITKFETFKIVDGDADTAATNAFHLADENVGYTNSSTYESVTIDASSITASDTPDVLTIDASLEANGKLTIKGGANAETIRISQSANFGDTITSGAGNDTIEVEVASHLNSSDSIDAGDGTDTLHFVAGSNTVTDAMLTGLSNIETITATANSEVTLTLGAEAAEAGITTINYNGNAAETLTVGSGFTNDLTVAMKVAGNTFTATNYTKNLSITATSDLFDTASTIKGGSGTDKITITGDGDNQTSLALGSVTGVEEVIFKDDSTSDVHTITYALADATVADGASFSITGSGLENEKVAISLAAETNGAITVSGGAGADAITGSQSDLGDNLSGGAGVDTFTFATAQFTSIDTVSGGAGNDIITFSDAATVVDADFTLVTGVEEINGESSSALTVTLGSLASAAGITTIDSVGGQTNTITLGSGFTNAFTYDLTATAATTVFSAAAYTGVLTVKADLGDVITSADTVTGGTGTSDKFEISGDGTNDDIAATQAVGITAFETWEITDNRAYSITTAEENVADGKTLTIDADKLTTNILTFDGSNENDGKFIITATGNKAHVITLGNGNDTYTSASTAADTVTATAGNNTISTGDGADIILAGTGSDNITSGAGNDIFKFATGNLTSTDTINGGSGSADELRLITDGSIVIDDDFTNITNVEKLSSLNTDDSTGDIQLTATIGAKAAAAGITDVVFTDATGVDSLTVTSGFSSNLSVTVDADGSAGNTVTATNYTKNLTVKALASSMDDTTYVQTLTGGSGTDTLELTATDTTDVIVTSGITKFETFKLISENIGTGDALSITTADGLVAEDATLTIDGSGLDEGSNDVKLTFDGSAEADGKFVITTDGDDAHVITLGQKNDTYTGSGSGATTITATGGTNSITTGTGADTITAGSGTDTITGGTGNDTYAFTSVANALGDSITDFASTGSGTNDTVAITLSYSTNVGAVNVNAQRLSTGVAGVAAAEALLTGQGGEFVYDTTNKQLIVNKTDDGSISNADYKIAINAATTAINTIADNDLTFTITGGSGDDNLRGGEGIDSITGGAGADNFLMYDTVYDGGAVVDVIEDFAVAQTDQIQLDISDIESLTGITDLSNLDGASLSAGALITSANSTGSAADLVNATGDEILLINNGYADAALLQADLRLYLKANGTTAAGDAILVAYDDGSANSTVAVVSTADGVANDALWDDAVVTDLITIKGVADATTISDAYWLSIIA